MNLLDDYRAEKTKTLLTEWAEWTKHHDPKTYYPGKSCGLQSGPQVVTADSSDEQQDEAEAQRCVIVDRCIDDLRVPAQKAAIHRCYVFSVYRMRDYGLMLEQAHSALQRAFMRKGILG